MTNEIIIVKQLPIIEERLLQMKTQITEKTSNALAMECTEDTYKDVKQVRADLNRSYKELEDKRKAVKKEVLSPYEQFEVVYKACISDIFESADKQLADKISDIEDGLKEQKKSEILEYFEEYLQSRDIDFLTFEDMELNITLSASKKSLKDKIKATIDKVSDDLNMIDTQEYKAEILVEYKQSLNVSQAIMVVTKRFKAIEKERERAETARIAQERQAATVQHVEEVIVEQQVLTAPEETHFEDNSPITAPVAVLPQFESAPTVSEAQRSIALSMRIDYPEDKYDELIQMCKEFKNNLMERGFTIVKY